MKLNDYVQILNPYNSFFDLKYGKIKGSDAGVLYLVRVKNTQLENTLDSESVHSWFHKSNLKLVTESEYLASFVLES